MKLGIMQPYFVPYIGYWQLMNAVDEYVIYDDVNFIKGGWINRNRILVNDQPKYFNVPMLGASSMKHINEVGVNNDPKLIRKNLDQLMRAYSKAPYYDKVFPLMEKILTSEKEKSCTVQCRIFPAYQQISGNHDKTDCFFDAGKRLHSERTGQGSGNLQAFGRDRILQCHRRTGTLLVCGFPVSKESSLAF